jgi:hypothetical protein
MFSQIVMATSTAKQIKDGSKRLGPGGLTENHQHPTEAVQILIAITHHASEVQQGRITIETRVVPAAETAAMVAAEVGVVEVVSAAAEVVEAEAEVVEVEAEVVEVEEGKTACI